MCQPRAVPGQWGWSGMTGCLCGGAPSPSWETWWALLTSSPDPETDVTCTSTLEIQLNIDVCGGWGEEGGQWGQVPANGMPHCITILQKPCPLWRITQAEGDEHQAGLGKRASMRAGLPPWACCCIPSCTGWWWSCRTDQTQEASEIQHQPCPGADGPLGRATYSFPVRATPKAASVLVREQDCHLVGNLHA